MFKTYISLCVYIYIYTHTYTHLYSYVTVANDTVMCI